MPHGSLRRTASLALVLAAPLSAHDPVKLVPSDRKQADHFGSELALSGSTLLASAPEDDDFGTDSGSVYLFDVTTGTELGKLVAGGLEEGDAFGAAVAATSTVAAVGVPGDDDFAAEAGAVVLYDMPAGTVRGKVLPTAGTLRFGAALALDADLLVVGNPDSYVHGLLSGAVHLVDVPSGQVFATLTGTTTGTNDRFGTSVAVSGGLLAVGAPNALDSGAVYVFDAVTGQELHQLLPPDPTDGDEFGCSVAWHGNTVVVGARKKWTGSYDTGAVYLFDATTGQQVERFVPGDGYWHHRFGSRVVVDGDVLLVGTEGFDHGQQSGSVYWFDLATGQEVAKVIDHAGKAQDMFGSAIALSGTLAVAGSPLDDTDKPNSGSVTVFRLMDAIGAAYCDPAVPNSTGEPGRLVARGTVLVADDCVELQASHLALGQSALLLTSQVQSSSVPPGSQGELCLGAPIGRYKSAVQNTTNHGYVAFSLDLTQTPTPTGKVAIQPGETWNFQLWYRDANPQATSNLTNAVAISFE